MAVAEKSKKITFAHSVKLQRFGRSQSADQPDVPLRNDDDKKRKSQLLQPLLKPSLEMLLNSVTVASAADVSRSHNDVSTTASSGAQLSRPAISHQRYSRHTKVKATSNKLLTSEERTLIAESWKEVQRTCNTKNVNFGLEVFSRIFEHTAELKELFGLELNQNIREIDETHQFNRHCNVFANMIDLTVRNIEELEVQITPALLVYGRRHLQKIGSRSAGAEVFTMKTLQMFSDCLVRTVVELVEANNGESCDEETVCAWENLIAYVVTKLKEGYDFATMHNKKTLTEKIGGLFAT